MALRYLRRRKPARHCPNTQGLASIDPDDLIPQEWLISDTAVSDCRVGMNSQGSCKVMNAVTVSQQIAEATVSPHAYAMRALDTDVIRERRVSARVVLIQSDFAERHALRSYLDAF